MYLINLWIPRTLWLLYYLLYLWDRWVLRLLYFQPSLLHQLDQFRPWHLWHPVDPVILWLLLCQWLLVDQYRQQRQWHLLNLWLLLNLLRQWLLRR